MRGEGKTTMAAVHQPTGVVLLVEDDADVRFMLSMILEAEGYQVATAADGREALDQLRTRSRPSLILLDLMMPVMDGWRFRAEQQQDPALASIPVVVISAADGVPQKAASIGAAGYLRKPIDFDALLDMVRRYC